MSRLKSKFLAIRMPLPQFNMGRETSRGSVDEDKGKDESEPLWTSKGSTKGSSSIDNNFLEDDEIDMEAKEAPVGVGARGWEPDVCGPLEISMGKKIHKQRNMAIMANTVNPDEGK